MKEKNLNSSHPGQEQTGNFLTQSQGHEDSDELSEGNDVQQDNGTDEYDNYAPWG